MGREGMSRRHAFYKMVSLVQGTNIVKKELGLPEAPSLGADPQWSLLRDEVSAMIRAAMVGLGWWGRTIVESVQSDSDIIRFVAGATRTKSADTAAFAEQQKLKLVDQLRGRC